METFTELNLNPSLMQSITRMHFKIPTPIQAQAIPHALLGKDILGTAQTGTGKTLCYGIACINKLCLLYTSPSPRDRQKSRMASSA